MGVAVIKLAKEFPSGQAALQEGKTLHTMAWQGHVSFFLITTQHGEKREKILRFREGLISSWMRQLPIYKELFKKAQKTFKLQGIVLILMPPFSAKCR